MTYRDDLWHIAAHNHAIVTTDQAAEAGVPAVEMRKLAARGALTQLGRGVYRHTFVPTTSRTDFAAAVAIAGSTAFLHRDAVLALLGLAFVNPRRIQVGDLRRNRVQVPRHIHVETRGDITNAEIVEYDGIRSTTVHQSLLDCLPQLRTERTLAATNDALNRGAIDETQASEVRIAIYRRRTQLANGT